MSDEEIVFDPLPDLDLPPVKDLHKEDMTVQVGDQIDRARIKVKMTGTAAPGTAAPVKPDIPPELPDLIFKIGAKALSCPAFALDADEARLVAKHLSIVCGGISSRLFSASMIGIIILSKILGCIDAIKAKFRKKETS